MAVKLIVRNTADPSFNEDHVFRQDCITIGRDTSNLLPLPDERRIVSKQHAEIRVEGGEMKIVDLGSKNYTYVNEQRVPSHEPTVLRHGDMVRIGEFEIQVARTEPEEPAVQAPADDRTVFAINPFWEPAEALRDALRQLASVYDREVPGRRREALLEAFDEVLEGEQDSEVVALLGEALGETVPDRPAGSGRSTSGPAASDSGPAPSLKSGAGSQGDSSAASEREGPPSYWQQLMQTSAADETPEPEPPSVQRAELPEGAEAEDVVELLLNYIADLLGLPWQFRHEFIGQTIVQSEASSVLYEGSAEELARFLLDPTLSDEEATRRKAMLAEAADALRRHQVAMLDGYKAAAREGVEHFLDEVDLEVIRGELNDRAKWYERPLIRLRALTALEEKVGELRNEEWTVIERRVFRPAFIKAYLARMTST